jgi:predicted amidohydrolase
MNPKVCTITLTATDDVERNLANMKRLIASAVENERPDWVVLPEVFAYIGHPKNVRAVAEETTPKLLKYFSEFARQHKVIVFAGSVHESCPQDDANRVFNSLYVFGRQGEQLAKYRKIHRFRLKTTEGVVYDETISFAGGNSLCHLQIDGMNVALAICYDLRFPAFFDALFAQSKFDVLVMPAAFTLETGRAHWEVLLRARAIEYQCFVVACNQTGEHGGGKSSFGHSMVIDPWGDILSNSKSDVGNHCATLAFDKIQEIRAKIPVQQNRVSQYK